MITEKLSVNDVLRMLLILTLTFASSSPANSQYRFISESNEATQLLIEELAEMFRAAKVVIFKNQPLINAKKADKSTLFGEAYLSQIRKTYQKISGKPFPKPGHRIKDELLKAMVDVMGDNEMLITDTDLGFKGLIPATYSSQLSHKFSTLGLGVKLKFTAPNHLLRNKLNAPDDWERKILLRFTESTWIKHQAVFDTNASLNGKSAFRYMTPLYHDGADCLGCHGMPENNPDNAGKPESEWTKIDRSGFQMEGVSKGQLGGGVSISILK